VAGSFSPKRLRALREHQHLSRRQLAVAIGVHEQAVVKYEFGHTRPTIAHLIDLADVLGVGVEDLLDRTEQAS
jgi:transcriptional regulator with XRE-family HTH domain